MVIAVFTQSAIRDLLDLVALSNQTASFGENHPEHAHRNGIGRYRESN